MSRVCWVKGTTSIQVGDTLLNLAGNCREINVASPLATLVDNIVGIN